jgi:hypothetical protein
MIVKATSSDRLTWVAYPKSGQLGTDLNRDILAALLIDRGVQPVSPGCPRQRVVRTPIPI